MAYADERIELLPRLRKLAAGRAMADALRLDGNALRFHLGTSLADLRVPVSLAPSVVEPFTVAVRDLVYLLAQRHRALFKQAEQDQLLLLEGFEAKAARAVSFVPPSQVRAEGVRRAFLEAPELHPSLDSGLFASWIASGRPGRRLVGALNAVLRRAVTEAGSADKAEPTAYLLLLALRRLVAQLPPFVRRLPPGRAGPRPFQGAAAMGLLAAARLAAREASVLESPSGALCEAALQPLAWLGGARQLAGSGCAAYGLAFEEPVHRLGLYAHKAAHGASVETLWQDAVRELESSEEAHRTAESAYTIASVRSDLLVVLRLAESARAPPVGLDTGALAQLYGLPGHLERTLKHPERRKDLHALARSAAKAATDPSARTALLSIARVCKELRDDAPGLFPERDVRAAYAKAVVALATDAAVDKMIEHVETSIFHREESEEEIDSEYERGRLYLVGVEERPILRGRAKAPQIGHLFCDVKDFTRRTAMLKEAVVADFLSREFYTPILTAAARHHHGASHLHDMGGIYLNNLLGDAVSFAGDVSALVALAHDIRRALQSYARRLENEASTGAVSRSIAAAEERYAARRAQVQQAIAEAEDAQRRGVLDHSGQEPRTRLTRLRSELRRIAEEHESELSLARGEKLEAGIFISYGAAPEVATFEDHVFGSIKVAIAEKINESARGTARNTSVRARVETLLRQERGDRGKTCPFSVFISQPLAIPVSAEAELAIRASIEDGDLEGAQLMLEESVRQFIARLAEKRDEEQGGDIYNAGAALSEEALHAYMDSRSRDLLFLRRTMAVRDLHPSITEQFVFPVQRLSLVAAVAPAAHSLHEVYVHAGRALFKGLEKTGGLGVYEIIPSSSAFFTLLAQHHLPAWLSEHEKGEGEEGATDGLWEVRTG
ncbi:MAG: hypothetical protein ACJ784_01965 [Myxococcales bacterium]